MTIQAENNIGPLEPRLLRRTVHVNVGDEDALGVLGQPELFSDIRGNTVGAAHAQIAARDPAGHHEAVHDGCGEVHRNGKADANVAARRREDGTVDPDETALGINERAARVAHVDRRIRLDKIFIAAIENSHLVTALGRDDAHGHGLAHTEGISDREHDIADAKFLTVGERHRRQLRRLNLDHGDVGLGIGTDHFGDKLTVVRQRDFQLIGTFHDVIVGKNVAVGGDDDSRAHPLLPTLALLILEPGEKLAKEWIYLHPLLNNLGRVDGDDRPLRRFDHIGIAGHNARFPLRNGRGIDAQFRSFVGNNRADRLGFFRAFRSRYPSGRTTEQQGSNQQATKGKGFH